mgnify:CR=1 FL=1
MSLERLFSDVSPQVARVLEAALVDGKVVMRPKPSSNPL